MSLNKVMLIGNVGKDPEVRYLDNGSTPNAGNAKVATFPLATTERYRDRNGELRENTEWHNIVAWRNSADVTEKFVKKGTQLYIEGRLRTRSWTDQSGQKHYTTEITVDNMQLLGKRSDNPGAQGDEGRYGQRQGWQAARPAVQNPVQTSPQPAAPAPAAQNGYAPQASAVPTPSPAPEQTAPGLDENPSDDLPF